MGGLQLSQPLAILLCAFPEPLPLGGGPESGDDFPGPQTRAMGKSSQNGRCRAGLLVLFVHVRLDVQRIDMPEREPDDAPRFAVVGRAFRGGRGEIGRASCRERVEISVVAV